MTYLNEASTSGAVSIELPADIFDPEAIANIKQLQMPNGTDILEQFMQLFLKTAKILIKDFNIGIKTNDLKKISFSLHTLKSSSASLGVKTFTDLCIKIETAALSGDSDTVFSHADELVRQFEEIEALLEQYIAHDQLRVGE